LRTVPLAQVPPVMVKPLVAVPAGVTVGAAVNVYAPAFVVAVFVTVIVPVSVPVLAVAGLSAGVGALIANVAAVTVNGTLEVVPPGVVTVMFRAPSVAPDVTLNVAVIVIAFTTVSDPVARLTPPPRPPMVVPVAVKFVPLRVTGTARVVPVAGRFAEFGLMEANVGAGGTVTVNGTVLVVVPIGVTTAMLLAVVLAVAEMLIWAATVVPQVAGPPSEHGSSTLTLPATRVTPVPRPLSDVAPVRLVPVNVKLRALLPRLPVAGLTPVSVGPSTVKPPARVAVPDPVVMLTFLAPRVAVVEMVRVAVAVCGFWTVKPLMVMPLPETAIPVAPVKLVPVSVT
jgi:hypothetical protein